jgi:hypothetical protein
MKASASSAASAEATPPSTPEALDPSPDASEASAAPSPDAEESPEEEVPLAGPVAKMRPPPSLVSSPEAAPLAPAPELAPLEGPTLCPLGAPPHSHKLAAKRARRATRARRARDKWVWVRYLRTM